MSDNRNRSAGARGVCSVDAGGLMTAPVRGQRPGWSLLGLWATRNGKAFGPREVLHDDVRTARCDGRSGPDDRSMR